MLRMILYVETQTEYIAGTISIFLASAAIYMLRNETEEQGKGRIPGLVFYAYYPLHQIIVCVFREINVL